MAGARVRPRLDVEGLELMCDAMDAMTFMGEASKRGRPRSAAILCVDDNATDLYRTELALRGAGHSVTVASNVADALLLLKVFHFDMVLLDCIPGFRFLTAEAKRIRPAVRLALCTDGSRCSPTPSVDAILHKPLAAGFLRNVAELLAGSEGA